MTPRFGVLLLAAVLVLLWTPGAGARGKRCKTLCRTDVALCVRAECDGTKGGTRRRCKTGCKRRTLGACRAEPDRRRCLAPPRPPEAGEGLFAQPMPWTTAVDDVPKAAASDRMIAALEAAGGWGTGTMRIDFSLEVLAADASTPRLPFTPTDDFYEPDCDRIAFPVPPGGALEGEEGYRCTTDGDCHLLVVDRTAQTLFEMWRADIRPERFLGGCAVRWDLASPYTPTLRGEGCTSADAAGLPITALLFSADEVAAGEIRHAIRFILPNDRIRSRTYVRPATHATGAASGGADLPPYGVRLRLRADYPVDTLPSPGARVVARALQRYGMFLADGGQIALTAQSDRFTRSKWADAGIDAFALEQLRVTDMEVVGMGEPITWSGDCVRN